MLMLASLAFAACSLLLSCGGSQDAPQERALAIDFADRALLTDVTTLAIYFYEDTQTCAAVRDQRPRPPSLLGPYRAELDDTGRIRGITFTLEDVPAGVYVVFVDALDINGGLVGTGCAPSQTVYDREISRIRITIS
jgi:hypothetical protein